MITNASNIWLCEGWLLASNRELVRRTLCGAWYLTNPASYARLLKPKERSKRFRPGVGGAGGGEPRKTYGNPWNRCCRAPPLPTAPNRVLLDSTLPGRFYWAFFAFDLVRANLFACLDALDLSEV